MLIVVLILACAASPEPLPDVEAYLQAARIAPEDPRGAADLCESVGGEAGAECIALTAAEVSTSDVALASELCERVEHEVWRDECGFLVADGAVRSGHISEAGPLCQRAGRFADNCLMHVWKRHAALCVDRADGLQAAATCNEPAFSWSEGVLEADEALRSRFWDVFFDASMSGPKGGAAHVDVARCAELSDTDLRARCERALPFTLQRALNRAGHKQAGEPGALDRSKLCDADLGTLPERVEAATGVRYTTQPALDSVVRHYVAHQCGGASPR